MSEVIDNFLDNETSNEIEKQLLSANFPWYYCENSTTYTNEHKRLLKDKNLKIKSYLQFTHDFYVMSEKTKMMHASKNVHLANKIIDEFETLNILYKEAKRIQIHYVIERN